ncbi:MAG: hypothetical protein BRD30_06280 [Bacteroidetes bacterium QH_2_63_10]|nr:MAG: hypothetical protein BRD30_06280 [Bacteroidetes bacterium QH_2_63_10]
MLAVIFLTLALGISLPACSGGGSSGGGNGDSGPTAPATPRSTSSGVGTSESPLDTGIGSADYVDDTAENGTKYYYVMTAVAEEAPAIERSGRDIFH